MKSRRLSRLPVRIRSGARPAAISASCAAKAEMTKSRDWPGPMWLPGRTVIAASPNSRAYCSAAWSAAAFVSE